MNVRGRKYPVKTTINLAQKERSHRDLGAVLPTAVVLAAVIALFCKFGVIDRLNAVSAVESQAAQEELLAAQLQEKTTDYQKVLEEYQTYAAADSLAPGADPMDCMALIEEDLLNTSQVSSFSVSSDLITVKLSGVTLNEISAIYTRLTASPLVSGVQVYTAATNSESSDSVTATMTIRLVVEEAPAAEGAAGTGEEAAG